MKVTRKVLTEHEQHILNVMAFIQKSGIVFYNARVAVIRDPEDSVTKGGIVIPDQAKRKIPRGTVVGIGLGVELAEDAPGTKIGDKVMYTKYNPILFNLPMPNGDEANIELMHVSDLYIGWRLP
jgi:co-chaperonin GroES (HSP10)